MNVLGSFGHLARRFVKSLSTRAPSPEDLAWVALMLLPGELTLWHRLGNADRRHSIEVARRFAAALGESPRDDIAAALGESPRDDIAAALLHDIGKVASGMGTLSRVLATLVGPRTTRFRAYHDHERLGLELARQAGSSAGTLELLAKTSDRHDVLAALRQADDI
jgi:hypothetical protein